MGYAGIRRGRWVLPAAAGLLLSACLPDAGQRGRAEAAYAAAAAAYGGERFEEALGYVEESLKIDGKFYQARLLKGKILFFLSRPAEAEGIFADLRAKYPEYTEARLWYLRCLVLPQGRPAGRDPEKIRSALDRELSFNPSDWRVLHLYALLAGNTGDWERRLSMGRRAENALNDSAKVYLDMALSWHNLGLKDRAILALDKARIVSGGNMSLARLIGRMEELIDGLEAGPDGGREFDVRPPAAGEPPHE